MVWVLGSLCHGVCDVTCVATDMKESSQSVYGEGLIGVVVEEWLVCHCQWMHDMVLITLWKMCQ